MFGEDVFMIACRHRPYSVKALLDHFTRYIDSDESAIPVCPLTITFHTIRHTFE